MKRFLKTNLMIFIFFILLSIIGGKVEALSEKKASYNVKVGDSVTITIPFEEKVSAAQFKLDYDKDKLTYSSYSCDGMGFFAPETNKFAFAASSATLDKVTFTFIAKSAGKTTVNVGDFKTSNESETSPLNTTIKISENKEKGIISKDDGNGKNISSVNKIPVVSMVFLLILLILLIIIAVIIIKKRKEDKIQG